MTLINMKHKTPPPNQASFVLQDPIPPHEFEEENNTKQTAMVPWSECIPLLDKIKELTSWGNAEILQQAGYTAESNIGKWIDTGVAAKRVKMALIGVLFSQGYSVDPTFTHDELADLFMVTTGRAIPNEHRRKLLTKIAKEMTNHYDE